MQNRFWTSKQDAQLLLLRDQGATVHEIAARLGRTDGAVSTRLMNIGAAPRFPRKAWTEADLEQLRTLYLANIPVEEIAGITGRTIAAVRLRVAIIGLKRDARKTRLGKRYGIGAIANCDDPVAALAAIREREEQERQAALEQRRSKVSALLNEMQRGLEAGVDRGFMFTAALVGGATLQQIGDRVGITRERVRQVIEQRKDTNT